MPLTNLFGRVLFTILVLVFVSGSANAQVESSTFGVVQLDPSARIAAMGGASTALDHQEPSSIFANPALITPHVDGLLEVSYLNHLADLNAGWISYGRTIDSLGTFVAGIRFLSFGQFDETDDQGEKLGQFSASDMALSIGISRPFRSHFTYGVSVQALRSSLAEKSAGALTLDAGIFRRFEASSATVAASVHNLGVVVSSIGDRPDELPFDVRLGVTKRLRHLPLLLSLTATRLHKLDGGPDGSGAIGNLMYHLLLGAEFRFGESVQLRFGYNHRRHDELRVRSRLDLAGFSTGFGIKISRVGIDYAFNSWSSLGGLHRFSVQTRL